MIEITDKILKDIYKERKKGVYFPKYSFGFLLVIGGGEFYTGSPALSALAALNSGVDLVEIIAPKRASDIIASFSPNLCAYPLEGVRLEKKHLATLISFTRAAKERSKGNMAVVIGGGLGRSKETKETVFEYLSQINVPAVIDADAIHALEGRGEIIKGKPFLITPHSFEFFTLTGKAIYKLSHEEKQKTVKEEAARLQTPSGGGGAKPSSAENETKSQRPTILLKDKPDIISDGKEIALNKTGSPLMSVGGTGDVLAGICGALLARNIDPFKAAQAAAYISGLAGELAGKKLGVGLKATDVINEIPNVLPKF